MTAASFTFFVPGNPKPQGSKRAYVNRHTKRAVMVESGGQQLQDWRTDVQQAALRARGENDLIIGPVGVNLTFSLARPKSHPKTKVTWPTARPDVDKLARGVLDALTLVLFKDDSQVVTLTVNKRWATPALDVGCLIDVLMVTDG